QWRPAPSSSSTPRRVGDSSRPTRAATNCSCTTRTSRATASAPWSRVRRSSSRANKPTAASKPRTSSSYSSVRNLRFRHRKQQKRSGGSASAERFYFGLPELCRLCDHVWCQSQNGAFGDLWLRGSRAPLIAARPPVVLVPPHARQERLAREDLAGMRCQELQQLVLHVREVEWLALAGGLVRLEVEHELAVLDELGASASPCSPEEMLQARFELARMERREAEVVEHVVAQLEVVQLRARHEQQQRLEREITL